MIRVLIIVMLLAGIIIDEYHDSANAGTVPILPHPVYIVYESLIDGTVTQMHGQGYELISCTPFIQRMTGPVGNGVSTYQEGRWENEVRFVLLFKPYPK